jgi:hypothetical protein
MQRLASALLTVAVVLACDGATAPTLFKSSVDDLRVPETLRAAYQEDAARLALRELVARPGGFDEVTIPSDVVRNYYHALILVYNATALPARDSVVDVYGIHTFPQPATRSIYMIVAGDQEWAQRLVRDRVPTGDAVVDGLLRDYALSFERAYTMSTGEFLVVLRSALALNMAALAPKFVAAPGVRASQPNGAWGDSDDIDATRGDAILVDYSVGYGDCPSGCIGRRFYHFAVHPDGTVEYRGASGSPPPFPGTP